MSTFEFLILSGAATIGLIFAFIYLLPPIQFMYQRTSLWFDHAVLHHYASWFGRLATSRREHSQQQSNEQFLKWLETRVNGEFDGDQVDESLVEAQRLTPLLRFLLQEEIPNSIRRCNAVHLRMALISGAAHMREISYESECLGLRRWMSRLLMSTDALLQQYPLNLRVETDELLNASIIVRKSLLSTCRVCPYVQRTVAEAGVLCPAAKLIQVEVRHKQ